MMPLAPSAHSTRKTSIRTRKIRGEDSFVNSISIAEREGEPEGISNVIRCGGGDFGHQYGTAGFRKKAGCRAFGAGRGNFGMKSGLDVKRISQILTPEAVNGLLHGR